MRLPYYTPAGVAEHLDTLAWMVSWHIHWAKRGLVDFTLRGRVRSDLRAAQAIVLGLQVVHGQRAATPRQAAALAYALHGLLTDRWLVWRRLEIIEDRRTLLQLDALNWLSERLWSPRTHAHAPHESWADIQQLAAP